MATSPSTIPFVTAPIPTTAPAPMYAPITYLPPPPFGFGAPPYAPYHHPYSYFPSTYPYPSPAAAHAPPPGFVPAPAYAHPPPFPYPPPTQAYDPFGFYPTAATTSSAAPPATTTKATSSTPTTAQPWVASSPSPGLYPVRVPEPLPVVMATAAPVRSPDGVLSTPIPCGACSKTEENGSATPRKDYALQVEKTAGVTSISEEKLVHKHGPGLVSMANNVPDHSFVGLQATSTATASGSTTTRTSSSRVFSASSMSLSAATAYAAPQVFGEMPTPSSCNGTAGYDHYSSGHQTPAQFSCVQAGSTNLNMISKASATTTSSASSGSSPVEASSIAFVAPQVVGEMPRPRYCTSKNSSPLHYYQEQGDPVQRTSVPEGHNNLSEQNLDGRPNTYGFHNLDRQSVVLADGTKRSYFTLPAVYPLERATPPMSPSADQNASVMAPLPVEAQAAGLTPSLCSNDNLQLPLTVLDTQNICKEMHVYDIFVEEDAPCPNIISHVQDFTLELQQQDDKKALTGPVQEASDLYVTRYNQFSTMQRELRLLWDPGASTPLHSSKFGTSVQQLKDASWNALIVPALRTEWDPGDKKIHNLLPVAADATKLQYGYVYNPELLHVPAVTFGTGAAPIFASAIMCSLAFQSRWTELNASALLSLFVPCSTGKSCSLPPFENWVNRQWNPGIELSSDIYIWPHMRTVKTSTWLQSQLFNDLHYELQPRKAFKKLICYSSIFSSTALYVSTATNVCNRLVLTSGKLAQSEKDATDMYQVFKTQLPMRKTTHIWDPGTMLLQYRILFTEEKEMVTLVTEEGSFRFNAMPYFQIFEKCIAMSSQLYWHEHNNFNGIALWVVRFQPP